MVLVSLFLWAAPLAALMAGVGASQPSKKSPGRKKKSPGKVKTSAPTKIKGKASPPTIRVLVPDPIFKFEMYFVEKNAGEDAFMMPYTRFVREEIEDQGLKDANFGPIVFRRDPGTDDEPLEGQKGFWRQIIIRYPSEQESTPETREEGLRVLKAFFLRKDTQQFPPSDITTHDAADPENPPPLDRYFMNETIKNFMEEDINETSLNESFVQEWPEIAAKCWASSQVSQWAYSLGFPINNDS